jgi:hypothetical protein
VGEFGYSVSDVEVVVETPRLRDLRRMGRLPKRRIACPWFVLVVLIGALLLRFMPGGRDFGIVTDPAFYVPTGVGLLLFALLFAALYQMSSIAVFDLRGLRISAAAGRVRLSVSNFSWGDILGVWLDDDAINVVVRSTNGPVQMPFGSHLEPADRSAIFRGIHALMSAAGCPTLAVSRLTNAST